MAINRGEVWWVDFDPSTGSEIKKIRPAVIVSVNSANQALRRVQVVPLTTNVTRVYPGECLVLVQDIQSKAMTDQIRTIDKECCGERLSIVSADDMSNLEDALRVQLGL
jgi:mRNA interferase MazF